MSEVSRISSGRPEQLPGELLDLARAVDTLPDPYRSELTPHLCRVMDSTRRRRRILKLVQEALGQLRLDMKYLVFDLQATRRERDAYQAELEDWRS